MHCFARAENRAARRWDSFGVASKAKKLCSPDKTRFAQTVDIRLFTILNHICCEASFHTMYKPLLYIIDKGKTRLQNINQILYYLYERRKICKEKQQVSIYPIRK